MNDEILRLVDTIHRSKEIEKEVIFLGIEAALLSAVRKKLGESETIGVSIDRRTGEADVFDGDEKIDIEDLGRLAAMTGKQVLFQKIREAERDRIFEEFSEKVSTLVTGIVQRMEGPNIIVNLGKVEGFLPRSEQVPGERFKVGERIKVQVKEIRKNANRVKIILSRSSRELVKSLFALEVPEIADQVIEVKDIAREPGYRTKIAVTTYDNNVDCVGACVGVRGSRIKNIVDELFGEKIDIVRWNESIEVLIMNALKPAEISSMDLDFDKVRAVVYVRSDQQSLAIGKRGQNVRLASKLSGWDLDIVTVSEEELEKLRTEDISETDELDKASAELEAEADETEEAVAKDATELPSKEPLADEAAEVPATLDEDIEEEDTATPPEEAEVGEEEALGTEEDEEEASRQSARTEPDVETASEVKETATDRLVENDLGESEEAPEEAPSPEEDEDLKVEEQAPAKQSLGGVQDETAQEAEATRDKSP